MTSHRVLCEKCQGRGKFEHEDQEMVCGECEGYVAKKVRRKANYVGAPAIFRLELYCQQLNDAFGAQCYLVGSATERSNWRDVDVRMIMDDEEFAALFPDGAQHSRWEFDPRWIIMTTSISAQMSEVTGLPIDFQFQPRQHANDRHGNPGRGGSGTHRSALGMYFKSSREEEVVEESEDDPPPSEIEEDVVEAPTTDTRRHSLYTRY